MDSANTIETRHGAFGMSDVVLNDVLFVHNGPSPPDAAILAHRIAWRRSVEGVRNRRMMTVGATMPASRAPSAGL